MIISLVSVTGGQTEQDREDIEKHCLETIGEQAIGKNGISKFLESWDALLPVKIDQFFKAVMEMNLADFKANYRKHTTNVNLIVSYNNRY